MASLIPKVHISIKVDRDETTGISIFLYPLQTMFGGYIGITLSVRPSIYLVSATPPKRLIGFL